MARPTEAKIRKAREDLDKLRLKVNAVAANLRVMSADPRGSDVEICKCLKRLADDLSASGLGLADTATSLEGPEGILRNRRAKGIG